MHCLGHLRQDILEFWTGEIDVVRLSDDDMGKRGELMEPSTKELWVGIVCLGV